MRPSRTRPPAPLRALRLAVIGTAGAQVLILAVLLATGMRSTGTDTLWIALPLILGAADLVLVPAVGSTVRPLPYGVDPDQAERISAGVIRTVTLLRLSLAEAPALFGLVAATAGDSLLPYLLGLLFTVPLLVLSYPGDALVGRVRERLESRG